MEENNNENFYIPDGNEFRSGYEAYTQERMSPIYFNALSIISRGWGNPAVMAQGSQVLIRAWNRFYANFSFDCLVNCIQDNLQILTEFRDRDIFSLSDADEDKIKDLFNNFLEALKRISDNRKSAVSVAKVFSLLATNFFPLWDSNIAFSYNCFYLVDFSAISYIKFCKKMKILAGNVKQYVPNPDDRSILKRIDEYNYSKYTMHWI